MTTVDRTRKLALEKLGACAMMEDEEVGWYLTARCGTPKLRCDIVPFQTYLLCTPSLRVGAWAGLLGITGQPRSVASSRKKSDA